MPPEVFDDSEQLLRIRHVAQNLRLVADDESSKIRVQQLEQIARFRDNVTRWVRFRHGRVDEFASVQPLAVRQSLNVERDGFTQQAAERPHSGRDALAMWSINVHRDESPQVAESGNSHCAQAGNKSAPAWRIALT